ncbi:dnaJ (Hsp40) homolog, subfamily C, member 30b [Cottoperca gobio]|uniref:DnaJ (Hsp40) homolog, subfamily C, member 30b n=1 Tax=Cottoperca gobio TaxID=56716 RepID=A0A6J2QYX6_COTGO|nr:uncharacterized protein LOC115017835 [Cottoperca gobio]
MAEVGQRLGSGAYRLSALRNSQSRGVCPGGGPQSLLINSTLSDNRLKEESSCDQHREIQPASRSRATQRKSEKLRTSESQQESGTCVRSLKLNSSRFIKESLHAHTTALYLSARLQPLLQEKLLYGRMASWTRGTVSIHPDTCRSPQQLRAYGTVIFILAEQWSERLRHLKLHPDTLTSSRRSYSWRSDRSSKDAPPPNGSRTSYYDILRVSPTATQSQIKTAYYKQSFIYHPDKNPGQEEATQRFSDISEAYSVLGNISLRRKYDRGIFSRSDFQSTGRPSSNETSSRSSGSPHQHQYRTRRFSQAGKKAMFDFDAFYQAHYGEQLQREKDMRARKQLMQEQEKENLSKWKEKRFYDMTVAMLLAMAAVILVHLNQP